MTTTDRISRVFLQLTSPSWPDPKSSIGNFCRDLGSKKCWELTGPGLLQYQSLAKEVKEYLEHYCETETAIVHWTAYMVGRSTTSANPTVFFCSPQATPRKRVRRIVDRSGILEKYAGFKTGDSTRPPGLAQLVALAGTEIIKPVSSTRACTCECPTGQSISIHPAQSDQANHQAQNVATVGAIFLFGETLCFTTAAHAFRTENIGFDSQDGADFEFDLSDDESDGEVGSECVSPGVQQTSDLQYSIMPALETSPVQPEDESQSVPQSGSQAFFGEKDIVFSSLGTDNPFLDYVLVELMPRDTRLMQTKTLRTGSCDYHSAIPTIVASSNRGGAVQAFTGSGQVISGTLSKAPSFMTSISCHVTQELWSVKFGVKLAHGVCGSMVVDPATGEYVGHVIAGDPLSGSALIVPATDVLDDVRKRSKKTVSLAGSDNEEKLPTSDGSAGLLAAKPDVDIELLGTTDATISQSPDTVTFAQVRDQLNQKITATPRNDLRVLLKHQDQKNLLRRLYRTSILGLEEHDTSPFDFVEEFVEVVIGDGPLEARVKIFAAVLGLTTDHTAEIWTRFISALALDSPNDRHRDFRDECIPEFDLEYIENQLGKRFASIFEEKLCDFCPPDSDCKFNEKLGALRELVEGVRHYYKTETWTYQYNQELKRSKKWDAETESTGHCWPQQAALKIVKHNKELLREFYLEHIKCSPRYTEASPIKRRHMLQQSCEESDQFLSGVQTRVRILATLLSVKVPWEAHAWHVFIEACMSGSPGADSMLDEHLPYTPDDIDRIFKHEFDHAVRDSFHDRQFSFCLLKIRRPSSERSESRVPVGLAHMPFLRKQKCGEGASNVAVFYVDIIPGHIQNINDETWNVETTRLAMKQISFNNNANQEVKVNMLIQAQACKHNHIIEIRGICWLHDAVLIFMEPADCNLYEFMTDRCPYPAYEPKIRKARLQMFTKISNALVHLHAWLEEDSKKMQFMHKDLKAENILVMLNHDDVERSILKLTDFGLSSIKAESSSRSNRGSPPIDRSSRTRLPTTAVHFAPEALENKIVTKKSDVWAFGTGLAEVIAWIAKGSEGLKDLERERRRADTNTFWTLENGKPALSPVVTAWFESLIAEPGLSEDAWLMYKSCWLLLKHVCLVCDPERRGKMEDVQKFLQYICNGNRNVPDTILSEFAARANDETGHTGNTEDDLTISPTTITRSTQYSWHDSVFDATGDVLRTSTGSGNRRTTMPSSAESSTSSPPVADKTLQNASSKRTRRLPWPFNRNKISTGSTLPRDAPPSDSRGTTSVSNAIQRQQSPAGTRVGAAEQHLSRVTDQSARLLQEAVLRGHPDSVIKIHQLLTTEQGRNAINTEDKNRMTPLLHALQLEDVQAAVLLIEKGADINMVPNSAWSALHYAVRISGDNGGLPTILLRRSPGLIKKKDQGGDTVLHKLAGSPKGSLGRLEELVEALEESDIGRSALDEALRSRNGRMKTPLESLQGDVLSRGDRENLIKLLTPLGGGPESSRSDF
jgi:serine/threonine protein kinase